MDRHSFQFLPVHRERGLALKSTISSLVYVGFRTKLFTEHHSDSLCISSLWAVLSSREMRPTTVVSANFMMLLDEWTGVQRIKKRCSERSLEVLQCLV